MNVIVPKFKCLRCGYCCIVPQATIVHPDHINEKIKVNKTLDYIEKLCTKPAYAACPHLKFGGDGKAICSVYNKEWFSGTMCKMFQNVPKLLEWYPSQLLTTEYECVIGRYVLDNFPPNWWKDWWIWVNAPIVQ